MTDPDLGELIYGEKNILNFPKWDKLYPPVMIVGYAFMSITLFLFLRDYNEPSPFFYGFPKWIILIELVVGYIAFWPIMVRLHSIGKKYTKPIIHVNGLRYTTGTFKDSKRLRTVYHLLPNKEIKSVRYGPMKEPYNKWQILVEVEEESYLYEGKDLAVYDKIVLHFKSVGAEHGFEVEIWED